MYHLAPPPRAAGILTGTITSHASFSPSGQIKEIDFSYDHNGLHTQKKVVENGVTTTYDYTLHGKLITHLTKRTVYENGTESTEEMHFFYDAQSRPAFHISPPISSM